MSRVRALAEAFVSTELLSLSIVRQGESIELGRNALPASQRPDVQADAQSQIDAQPARLETISADLVGVFHLSRPAPATGDLLESDRELAFVEALGIRNPVRSRGAGRIVTILRAEGDAVEYGQPLFEIDRG